MRPGIQACAAGVLVACVLATPRQASAHQGPPYPLLVDQQVGRYVVSVWADPDVGVGTFYVLFEPLRERVPVERPRVVQLAVTPVTKRLPEKSYDAVPQSGSRVQYMARVDFDRSEFWDVRVFIDGVGGSGVLSARVEATPDGTIGPIGMVVYLVPFLLVAGLWIRVTILRRRVSVPNRDDTIREAETIEPEE